jgi:hypothetical protein
MPAELLKTSLLTGAVEDREQCCGRLCPTDRGDPPPECEYTLYSKSDFLLQTGRPMKDIVNCWPPVRPKKCSI